jgi:hypothetical protein
VSPRSVDNRKREGQWRFAPDQGDGPVQVRRLIGVACGVRLHDHPKSAIPCRELVDN